MAANNLPIFTKSPNNGSVLVTAANTSSQGGGTIGTDIFLVLTGGANGTLVDTVRLTATATTPTTTTATVARIFISTQASGATTSANTWLIAEWTLPAVAADNATAQAQWFDVPIGRLIPSSSTILVTNHAAPAANTAWRATAFGADY